MSTNAGDYNSFLNPKSPWYFQPLAFAKEMPLAAGKFRIGWQRSIKRLSNPNPMLAPEFAVIMLYHLTVKM